MTNYRGILTDCRHGRLDVIMEFNPSMYKVVRMASSRTPLQTQYILHGEVLEAVSSASTWGEYLQQPQLVKLMWTESHPTQTSHSDLVSEMSKTSPLTSEKWHRPQLEYASAVWYPATKDKTLKVEMVKRRAAQLRQDD